MQFGCCFCMQDRIIAGASHGIASSLTILLAIVCLGIYTDTIPEARTLLCLHATIVMMLLLLLSSSPSF